MTAGMARTAAARAANTRRKHDRWIAELSHAGWAVVQASHITLRFSFDYNENSAVELWCSRCSTAVASWENQNPLDLPLPRVLHAVSGHTCEEPK